MTEELFRADHYLKTCEATVTSADVAGIQLDRTVFYVTGGGQPGDTGILTLAGGQVLRIADTRKDKATGAILHIPEPGQVLPEPGARLTAAIDWRGDIGL